MATPDGVLTLLLENKVDAQFQPNQAQRYRLRGEAYRAAGKCSRYRTVLIAPTSYLGGDGALHGFDATVTYEAVRDWFLAQDSLGTRRHYKASLLSAAIVKSKLGYNPVADAPVSDFWHQYWQLANECAPELEMPEPTAKPARAGFVYFRPLALSKRCAIVHKLRHGNVDLQLAGLAPRVPALGQRLAGVLSPAMTLAKAGKSAAVRLRVPILDTGAEFNRQTEVALGGLAAASTLLAWYVDHAEFIDALS